MKRILLALALCAVTQLCATPAPPDAVGWIPSNSPSSPRSVWWGVYVGNNIVMGIAHRPPVVGQEMVFQNGVTATVVDMWKPRGGYYAGLIEGADTPWVFSDDVWLREADVAIGVLDQAPAGVEPVEIIWERPAGLSDGGQIDVEGWAFNNTLPGEAVLEHWTGKAVWTDGHAHFPHQDKEWNAGLYTFGLADSFFGAGAGGSGSPIFHEGKLLSHRVGSFASYPNSGHPYWPDPLPPQIDPDATSIHVSLDHPWFWIAEEWPQRLIRPVPGGRTDGYPAIGGDGSQATISWVSPYPWNVQRSRNLIDWYRSPAPIMHANGLSSFTVAPNGTEGFKLSLDVAPDAPASYDDEQPAHPGGGDAGINP